MRIESSFNQFSPVTNEKAGHSKGSAQRSQEPERQDTAELSSADSGVSRLRERAMSTPETRSARVESLRAAVASGTYSLNSQAIADAMFNELF